jgi:hypothetical protein
MAPLMTSVRGSLFFSNEAKIFEEILDWGKDVREHGFR